MSTAMTAGLLDVIWAVARTGSRVASWRFLVLPLAVATLACLGVFCLLYWALRRTRLSRGSDAMPALLRLSFSILFAVALIDAASVVERSLRQSAVDLLLLGLIGAGFILGAHVLSRRPAISERTLLAAPLVLVPVLGYVLLEKHWIDGFRSPSSLIVTIVLVILLITVARWARQADRARLWWPVGFLFVLLILAASTALLLPNPWSRAPSARANSTGAIKRVILITIDTLRADHLGCYGADGNPTPHLDGLAGEGVLFEESVTGAPWTLPAVASIMTGVSPLVHGMTESGRELPGVLVTLAERMRRAGYRTAAVGKNVHLSARSGFSRGFDQFNFFPKSTMRTGIGKRVLGFLTREAFAGDASTERLTELALSWLRENRDQDFFFWLHYFDPHAPYAPPRQYLNEAARPKGWGLSFDSVRDTRAGYLTPGSEERRWIRRLYEGEVRHVDAQIGAMVEALRELGIYDESLIIVSSDHGEEFWEHGGFEHGHSLYEEVLRVPLIIKLPATMDRWWGTRLQGRVNTERLTATALDLSGVALRGDELAAPSLRPLWEAGSTERDMTNVFSSSLYYYEDRISVSFDGFKYIRWLTSGFEELYDLNLDPAEALSLAGSAMGLLERGRGLLSEYQTAQSSKAATVGVRQESKAGPDETTEDRLRALGYLQ